jgi:hypothetical protein
MHEDGEDCDVAHVDFTADDVLDRDRATERVTAFLVEALGDPGAWARIMVDPAQTGHDLWLTANRHGAGFWDRDLGSVGERLTAMAHNVGGASILVDADGPTYIAE